MKPTITSEDMCLANPFTFDTEEIKRFDIVVFKPNEEQRKRANDENVRYMMRVVGLPDEKIEIKNNRIFINEQLINEPFEKIISEEDFKIEVTQLNVYLIKIKNESAKSERRRLH